MILHKYFRSFCPTVLHSSESDGAQNVNYGHWVHGMIVAAFWERSAAITVRIEYINHLQIAVYYTTPTDSLWQPPNQSPLKMTKEKLHLLFIAVRDCDIQCRRQPPANGPSKWIFGVFGKYTLFLSKNKEPRLLLTYNRVQRISLLSQNTQTTIGSHGNYSNNCNCSFTLVYTLKKRGVLIGVLKKKRHGKL